MSNASDISMQKAQLRSRMRVFLSTINVSERAERSRVIFSKLKSEPHFLMASAVFCYAALPSEADTVEILDHILHSGKKLYLPRMNAAGGLDCCQVADLSESLTAGKYGVPEPKVDCPALTDLTEIDFALIPGLAFDRSGRRLGRGLGYFDRFLENFSRQCFLAGLCFYEQLFDAIPFEPHDIAMNLIVTDSVNE